MKKIIIPALALIAFMGVSELQAQTTIVFNINLKPQLEDSVFVPGRGDVVQLTGNLYPLGRNRTIQLRDEEPIDSVYTAEVRFSRTVQGERLEYNYVLKTIDETLTEMNTRQINLTGGKREMDPLYFDAYAW